MYRKSLSIFFIFGVSLAWSQFSLVLSRKTPAKTKEFRIDPIGNVIWFENDLIYKYDTTGNLQFQQSLKSFGRITDIDVSNPMKFLVFFKEQQLIGFFDNTFTPYQQKTRLNDLGVSYATLVCYSLQFDRFWVYDQDNSKLWLFNSHGKLTLESENLSGLLGISEPVQMLEKNGNLYLVDRNRGVFVFDMFGSLEKQIELPGVQWIQVVEDGLFFITETEFGVHRTQFDETITAPIPFQGVKLFSFFKGQLIILHSKELHYFDYR